MNKPVLAIAGILFSANIAFAQTSTPPATNAAVSSGATTCEMKAVGKNGKPLAGAAKNAFMKKCQSSATSEDKQAACAAKAIDKNGKSLAGAAKSAFMKKCEAAQ